MTSKMIGYSFASPEIPGAEPIWCIPRRRHKSGGGQQHDTCHHGGERGESQV
jgi:hypothetical protein